MALTEESYADKIEVVGDFAHVQVRTATVIKRDGEEISRSFHRHVVAPGDDYSASSYGTAGFTYDASSPDFTPYDSLTEEQVLGWVWNDGVDKDATEAALQAKIDAQMNPTTADGVPW